eukprot:15367193-Ditylum_brightwellii.AAC.4
MPDPCPPSLAPVLLRIVQTAVIVPDGVGTYHPLPWRGHPGIFIMRLGSSFSWGVKICDLADCQVVSDVGYCVGVHQAWRGLPAVFKHNFLYHANGV